MNNKPPTDFDLPVIHLPEEGHYVPAKAYDELEIARRRSLPQGTLRAEFEQGGIAVVQDTLDLLGEDPDELEYFIDWAAPSATNSSFYDFAQNSEDVMRRRLKLTKLAEYNDMPRPTTADLRVSAEATLAGSSVLAERYVRQLTERSLRQLGTKIKLGRSLGSAALDLSCVPLGDQIQGMGVHAAQDTARQAGLRMLHNSRTLHKVIGSHPSLAQWSDPDSDVAVHIRRHAPTGVRAAFMAALESQRPAFHQLKMFPR